jgi:hypothetical protein
LRYGYPVVVPNIGAFPERVKNRDYSYIIDWKTSNDIWADFWHKMIVYDQVGSFVIDHSSFNPDGISKGFYKDSYLKDSFYRSEPLINSIELMKVLDKITIKADRNKLTLPEKTLTLLWRARNHSSFYWFRRLVPEVFQRKVKRLFSRRSIHELLDSD